MTASSPFLTLDSNVIISAAKIHEPQSEKCYNFITKVIDEFVLVEPSIIYQEVCGTLSRKMNTKFASNAKDQLDLLIKPQHLVNCDRKTCVSAFTLCAEHKIYAIDALYLHVALNYGAILVSLDKEFIDGLNPRKLPIEAYTVDNFPY